jgi:hypothetical protein
MTKTQDLLTKISAGTHRISEYGHVTRFVPGLGEWVTDCKWRKDVVLRAQIELKYGSKMLPVCAHQGASMMASVS